MAKRPIHNPRPGFSTLPRYPKFKTERRIRMRQIVKRPLRFQARSIVRREELKKDPWWYTLHRRGPKRTWVGENPLEARAIQGVRGTLPERIIYKYLVELLHLVPDIDFDFQSSLQGGRISTGGIVADFMFPYLMIVLQVQGPTHYEFRRIAKDDEQTAALAEQGYQVIFVGEEEIYDEYLLEDRMRKIFNLAHSGGPSTVSDADIFEAFEDGSLDKIFSFMTEIREILLNASY